MNEVIRDYLLWRHCGPRLLVIYESSDGRITIPKYAVSDMNWENKRLYLYFKDDSLILSDYNDGNSVVWSFNSKSRIRIPATIVASLENKGPVVIAITDNCIVIRKKVVVDREYEIYNSLMENLDYSERAKLYRLLAKEKVEENPPQLLLPDQNKPLVFRVVGAPTYISIVRSKGGLCLVEPDVGADAWLVPSRKKEGGDKTLGFLLIDKIMYKKMSHSVREGFFNFVTTAVGVRQGLYRLPNIDIEDDLIEKAKSMSVNKFLSDNFTYLYENEEYKKVSVFTKQSLEWRNY